jgi:hypothetical protein
MKEEGRRKKEEGGFEMGIQTQIQNGLPDDVRVLKRTSKIN